MKQSILDQKHFYNEKATSAYVESIIWKDGNKCPHYNTKEITDLEYAEAVLAGIMGKRLTYRIS